MLVFSLVLAAAGCHDAPEEVLEPWPEVVVDPNPVLLEPHSVFVLASFGYDDATGQAVPFEVAGEARPVTLVFEVVSEAYLEVWDDRYLCRATLSTWEPVTAAPRELTPASILAVDLPATLLEHDCAFLPPGAWPDPAEVFGRRHWSFGLGPLSPDLEASLRDIIEAGGYDYDADYAPYILGGAVRGEPLEDHFEGAWAPYDWAQGYGADADMVMEDTEGQPWAGEEEPGPELLRLGNLEGELPHGVYMIRRGFGLEAEVLRGG